MKQIEFKSWIPIDRKTVERFAKRPLPEDFCFFSLQKVDNYDPSKIEYALRLVRQVGEKRKVETIGKISATKRYLSPICQKQDGSFVKLKDIFWDRRVEIFKAPEGEVRYGEYGLTKAMVYAFMKELDEQKIPKVSVCISGDNISSLKLSEALVGTKERMEIMTSEQMPNGKIKFKHSDVYLQILNVKKAILEMEKRFPLKKVIQHQILKQTGRN